jgi:hypothetical protein
MAGTVASTERTRLRELSLSEFGETLRDALITGGGPSPSELYRLEPSEEIVRFRS